MHTPIPCRCADGPLEGKIAVLYSRDVGQPVTLAQLGHPELAGRHQGRYEAHMEPRPGGTFGYTLRWLPEDPDAPLT